MTLHVTYIQIIVVIYKEALRSEDLPVHLHRIYILNSATYRE